jgi:hypothetical protein
VFDPNRERLDSDSGFAGSDENITGGIHNFDESGKEYSNSNFNVYDLAVSNRIYFLLIRKLNEN